MVLNLKSCKYFSFYRYKRAFYAAFKRDRSGVSVRDLIKNDVAYSQTLDLLVKLFPDNPQVSEIYNSGTKFYQELLQRQDLRSPQIWNAGPNLCTFLYTITNILKPKIVVETGVANGFTTLSILKGLESTDGELHSFDIDKDTKEIGRNYPNWHWHQIDSLNPLKSIKKSMNKIEAVDLWVHDSDHSYFWQWNEYKIAKIKLNRSGMLISDDIDFSRAWSQISSTFSDSYVLFDHFKFIGIAHFRK